MSTYILCPHCSNDLGSIFPAFQLLQIAHNKKYFELKKNIHPTKVDLKPNIIKNIDYILNSLDIYNMCCRMHIMCYVDFDNIYKWY
jgi:DNA-directed RNA polymerase subunit N (RpoN/RPB10)